MLNRSETPPAQCRGPSLIPRKHTCDWGNGLLLVLSGQVEFENVAPAMAAVLQFVAKLKSTLVRLA